MKTTKKLQELISEKKMQEEYWNKLGEEITPIRRKMEKSYNRIQSLTNQIDKEIINNFPKTLQAMKKEHWEWVLRIPEDNSSDAFIRFSEDFFQSKLGLFSRFGYNEITEQVHFVLYSRSFENRVGNINKKRIDTILKGFEYLLPNLKKNNGEGAKNSAGAWVIDFVNYELDREWELWIKKRKDRYIANIYVPYQEITLFAKYLPLKKALEQGYDLITGDSV